MPVTIVYTYANCIYVRVCLHEPHTFITQSSINRTIFVRRISARQLKSRSYELESAVHRALFLLPTCLIYQDTPVTQIQLDRFLV